MDRSRSKRVYYYDQDYGSQHQPRNKRFHHHNNNHHFNNNNRRGGNGGRLPKHQDSSTATTSYRILCHDAKAGGVIGKSGTIIKAIRQETGAWINVHPLVGDDVERIIEISDARRRDPDGRMPDFSPAQEALLLIHDRIIESEPGIGFHYDAGDDVDGTGVAGRVAARLVVSKANVGSLLGKGGKIIEQMRIETQTQIRILPTDHTPSCVSMTEEIVQVIGDINNVRRAVTVISARLRESQLRERGQFHGRLPDQLFLSDDDFAQMNNMSRRSSMAGSPLDSRFSGRSSVHLSHSPGYTFESGTSPVDDNEQSFSAKEIVFQMCCPCDKVDRIMGDNGLIELLQGEVGVDIKVTDPVPGSDERAIIITSDEGPNNELFPAQEALLHIQTKIVDLVLDKDDIITTRLLVPSSEIICLDDKNGSLTEMEKLTVTSINILPKEDLHSATLGADQVVQIVGELKAARNALVEITGKLRSYLFREIVAPRDLPPPSIATPAYSGSMSVAESGSSNVNAIWDGCQGTEPPAVGPPTLETAWFAKDGVACSGGSVDRKENGAHEEAPSPLNRLSVPLVTRSILEVVVPEYAMSKLTMRSGSKLAQISELSGASVRVVEDRPESGNVIQISGSPEQAERAQSLLQGFILSTQEDAPS